jgi:hypothetical protein
MDPTSWKVAKEVIFEALQRPESEREPFVRKRCEDDAVRAEIFALLKDYSTSDDFLASHPDVAELEEQEELADLTPGTQLGHYIILDRLGRGGMGQVFLANDQELRRKVALKCLLSSRRGPDAERARVLREARAAAAINHPNVATIYQVVEHGDRAFIEMEYVDGESLAARLKRERLPIDRAVAIGCQLAAALAAAHSRDIVHRDLKPANVQLTRDGSVKVLDFGVAGVFAPSSVASSKATTGVATVRGGGTPPYMSPEQLLGHHVDDRSDIYSLGVVHFEMVAGRRPYTVTDPLDIVQAQAKGLPRADAVDPNVPRALADIIAKALEIDVNDRYQSATEVETALRTEYLERKGPWESAEPIWLKPARVAVGVLLVVLGVSVIGFATTTGFNATFGRVGVYARFGNQSWPSYINWGMLAIIPSVIQMTIAAVVVLALRFGLQLGELVGPIGRAVARLRDRGRAMGLAIGLNKPATLAQALVGLGIAMLALFYLVHRDLINAWSAYFNSAPIATLLPMGPQNLERLRYRAELDVMTLLFGFGLFKVLQLSKRATYEGKAAVAMLTGLILLMVLLNQFPYRVLAKRDFERVDLRGARCYITGQSSNEFLVLCPCSDPPRNRTVRSDDPSLRRLGIVENVFSGINSRSPCQ